MSALLGRRVLVTGAAGYVGRVVVETLAAQGAEVTALTRGRSDAPPGNQAVRWVSGDLLDPPSVSQVLEGLDCVIHAARSTTPGADARATEDVAMATSLLEAAERVGIRRIVELSTISAYQVPAEGTLDEQSPRVVEGHPYAVSKARIERVLLDRRRRCEVVVVQPANVCGGTGGWWSGAVLEMMLRGVVLVPEFGRGMANLVTVTDIARACAKAVVTDGIDGECFLLVDDRPTTWKDYFAVLERKVGRPATILASADECRRISRRARDARLPVRVVRWLSRRMLGRPIVFPLDDDAIVRYASTARFTSEKARARLGMTFSSALDI